MSVDFLFSILSGVGNLAQIVQLFFPDGLRMKGASSAPGVIQAAAIPSSGILVSKKRLALTAGLTLLTMIFAAVGFIRTSGSSVTAGPNPEELIATSNVMGYGTNIDPVTGKQLRDFGIMNIDIPSTGQKASKYNMVLLARAENNLVDQMKDRNIDKSVTFTISIGLHAMQVPLGAPTKAQLNVSHRLFLYVVALPVEYSSEQLASLSSIDTLKAKIMAQTAVYVP